MSTPSFDYPFQAFSWDLDGWLGSAERLALKAGQNPKAAMKAYLLFHYPTEPTVPRLEYLCRVLRIYADNEDSFRKSGLLSPNQSGLSGLTAGNTVIYALHFLVVVQGNAQPTAKEIIECAKAAKKAI